MHAECLDRLYHPKMEYYRQVYKDSERWNGVDELTNKTVIVYCEQGNGDIIQFIRYVPFLQERCKVILHCPACLHPLFSQFNAEMLDKDDDVLPTHDYHIPSMSLPFVLNQIDAKFPYLKTEEKEDLSEHDGMKIGIAWEGNPDHSNNDDRNCPLFQFHVLQKPTTKLFSLQPRINDVNLISGCEDMELYGSHLEDYLDTAKLINALDFIVSVDTSVLHLAGAMGKETYGLLSYKCDPRWEVKQWYPDLSIIRQTMPGDWDGVFCELMSELKEKYPILAS
jgi:hypothetical protein